MIQSQLLVQNNYWVYGHLPDFSPGHSAKQAICQVAHNVLLSFAPACYGDLNPVFASVGGGRFAACFRYTLRDSGGVLYGYPFSAKKEGEYLLVYGLSFSRWAVKEEDHPITFVKKE